MALQQAGVVTADTRSNLPLAGISRPDAREPGAGHHIEQPRLLIRGERYLPANASSRAWAESPVGLVAAA
jgi:hypothetical protein